MLLNHVISLKAMFAILNVAWCWPACPLTAHPPKESSELRYLVPSRTAQPVVLFPSCDINSVVAHKYWSGTHSTTLALEPRFFLSNGTTSFPAAELALPAGSWKLAHVSSVLVITVLVVGGDTRLTESVLSITERRRTASLTSIIHA